jgi:hypothetical protein
VDGDSLNMRCLFATTGEKHKTGRELLKCRRLGCDGKGLMPPSGKAGDLVGRECKGWPLASEWRDYIRWLVDAGTFRGEVDAIVNLVRRKKKGDLPPEIPRPVLAPLNAGLTDAEVKELFPDETDPTLIGNRIKALTGALGIPHCGGCDARRQWLNAAHEKLREWMGRA